jgi:hypothetical protein
MLDAGCWLLVAGCWLLEAGGWMLDAGCLLLSSMVEFDFSGTTCNCHFFAKKKPPEVTY